MDATQIARVADLLLVAQHAVALTGAGISTPSGIPDFRSGQAGLWKQHDPMVVASLAGFRASPQTFFGWFRGLARQMVEAEPNAAHYALATLEARGLLHSIITQNIDLLHTRAGSQQVYELHGCIRQLTCMRCFKQFPAAPFLKAYLDDPTMSVLTCPTPGCAGQGILKPDVILFGEQLPARVLAAAQREIRQCDLLVVAGSSLEVYPAADLPRRALAQGASLVIINREPTYYDQHARLVLRGDLVEVLPQLVSAVEARQAW
ncbi:MAG: NAD-dependent deacylase [Anaerolineae bacterium]|nr:NAD-dependent deacylase [Anaerolineae bacterium]